MSKVTANTPGFTQVPYEQNLNDLEQGCHELLAGGEVFHGIAGDENIGTYGLLAVDRDVCHDDGTYIVYLLEFFQFNMGGAGNAESGLLVYELDANNNVPNDVLFVDRLAGPAASAAPKKGTEYTINGGPTVVALKASTYADATAEADKWFASHQAPTARAASTSRLRRSR